MIKGQSSVITLGGLGDTYLHQAMAQPIIQSLLRSSSDLARVKVKRLDPISGKEIEIQANVEGFWKSGAQAPAHEGVWLREGDLIEVADKP
jgi:hypothetical protein